MNIGNLFNLSGRNALVTGAQGAIGSAIVKMLGLHGAKVFAGISPGSNYNHESDYVLGHFGVDLSELGAAVKLFNKSLEVMQRIDIVVNCAGVAIDQLFLQVTPVEWDKQINVNLRSSWELTQAALKHMMRNRWGRIISISSVIGHIGNPGQVVYSTTKSALYGMTKTLAKEVAPRNITLNTVSPGFIESAMTQGIMENEQVRAKIMGNIPVGYIGKPEDVAGGVIYLASEEARYITGIDLPICGGMYMG